MLLSILYCALAFASDAILVTATKNDSAPYEVPFSVGHLSGEDWDRYGGQAENGLSAVPGLSFSSGGGPGQTRSVFLRGARAEDTLVLVDGIPLNDPLSPSRSFDFSQFPTSDIERIEVLKGPQSVLYGSDAMGGVVQIFTKSRLSSSARLEGGSYGTIRARATHLGFHAGFERSDGISAADSENGNTERDGHKSWNLGGAREFSLGDRAKIRLQGLFHRNRTDTDRNGGAGGDSVGTYTRNSQLLFKADTLRISLDGVEWALGTSLLDRDRSDNTVSPAFYRARLWKAETSLKKKIGNHIPTAGGEYSEEAGRSSEIQGRRRFRGGAAYLQEQYLAGRWQFVGGGRLDYHSEHGRSLNYRAGIGFWVVPSELRVKASIGSGYKAPSLYQTYSIYGTPGLRPSQILGGDAGMEYSSGDWSAEATYFQNRFRDLIDFDSARSRYFNIGRAQTSGLELGLGRAFGPLSLKGTFTSLRSEDRATGQKLLRRPTSSGSAELSYQAKQKTGAALNMRYVGHRIDIHPSLFSRQNMPSFFLFGASAHHQLSSRFKLVARAENLLNRKYQETSGFGTPGLSGYLGIEAEL